MKKLLLALTSCFLVFSLHAQFGFPVIFASLGNKNVYKTNTALVVTRVYDIGSKAPGDNSAFTISPTTGNFIRYKVLLEEGNYKYIRILPGCQFVNNTIVYGNSQGDQPEDYVFRVDKTVLTPNTSYLASSRYIGKLVTLPARIRNEYWNGNNPVLQGSFALGYGFGWKFKPDNNPYRSTYISFLYTAGISSQKYFFKAGKYEDGSDSMSAKTDEIALTYLSLGLSLEFDKFNIGLFAGKDKMLGKLNNWAYQDKWWFGLGIGYELFK